MPGRTFAKTVATTVGAALIGGAVAVAGVLGATELMTPTATISSSESTAAGDGPGDQARQAHRTDPASCGALLEKLSEKLPDALVADLKALRDVAPDDRRRALRDIHESALDGKYGARAQEFAERGTAQRIWRELPAELRADLLEILRLPTAQVPDALLEVLDDAVAGEYGARVQFFAERIQAHVEDCGS